MSNSVLIRFYEELNAYLPPEHHKQSIEVNWHPGGQVGDLIVSLGVPIQQVDLILVNGESVPFSHPLVHNDRISVYPMFESFDIKPIIRVRESPLRNLIFIADVHLGKLSKYLRMLGFDTVYAKDFTDDVLISVSLSEQRILLSRDRQLMANPAIRRGYLISDTDPEKQLIEVAQRFDMTGQIHPLTRCLKCNGSIVQCDLSQVEKKIPSPIRLRYSGFNACAVCGKIYWNGDHAHRMRQWIREQIGKLT